MEEKPKVILPQGKEFIESIEVAALIAGAIQPLQEGEPVVTQLTKTAKANATNATSQWNGWPLDDDDYRLADTIWREAGLQPIRPPILRSSLTPYLESFNQATKPDWTLDFLEQTPEIQSAVKRYTAEMAHQKEVRRAIESGVLKQLNPITRIPERNYIDNGLIPTSSFRGYAGRFGIAVVQPGEGGGRYTLRQAAKLLAETGEREDEIRKALVEAASRNELPMYEPGKQIRYRYGPGFHKTVRDFYEEAHWNDLNRWLSQHEPRVNFRFPPPDSVWWYEATMSASTWWSLNDVQPRDAATLLCRLDPQDPNNDPEAITTDGGVTTPQDFRRLALVFSDVAASQPMSRRLIDWLRLARSRGLKYHPWIDEFEEACQDHNGWLIAPETAPQMNAPQTRSPETSPPVLAPGTPARDLPKQKNVTVHKLKFRKHPLQSLVDAATKSAFDPEDIQSVFAAMRDIAATTKPPPVIEVVEGEIKYEAGPSGTKLFGVKNLREMLKRPPRAKNRKAKKAG